jgi:hypothetical protein
MSKNGSDKDKDDKWDLWLACQRNSSEAWIIALSFLEAGTALALLRPMIK